MNGGMPFKPYALSGGLMTFRIPPTFIPGMPIFQHGSDLRFPRVMSIVDDPENVPLDAGDNLNVNDTLLFFSAFAPVPSFTSSMVTPPVGLCGPYSKSEQMKKFEKIIYDISVNKLTTFLPSC